MFLADHQTKFALGTTLRDNVDTYGTGELGLFVTNLVPALIHCITHTQPSFIRDAPEQQLRHVYLEILQRMPAHEHARPVAPELMSLMIGLIQVDNEENVILSIKIAVDMYRHHKPVLENQAQAFIGSIHNIYNNMPELVSSTFSGNANVSPAAATVCPAASNLVVSLDIHIDHFASVGRFPTQTW